MMTDEPTAQRGNCGITAALPGMGNRITDPKRRVVAQLLRKFFAHLQARVVRGSTDLWKRVKERAAAQAPELSKEPSKES